MGGKAYLAVWGLELWLGASIGRLVELGNVRPMGRPSERLPLDHERISQTDISIVISSSFLDVVVYRFTPYPSVSSAKIGE